MNTVEKYSAEELEALQQEGMAIASPEMYELSQEYLEINREIDRLNNTKKAIAAMAKEEAKAKGAKTLVYNGKEIFQTVDYTAVEIDRKTFEVKFPFIWKLVTKTVNKSRVDFKK